MVVAEGAYVRRTYKTLPGVAIKNGKLGYVGILYDSFALATSDSVAS